MDQGQAPRGIASNPPRPRGLGRLFATVSYLDWVAIGNCGDITGNALPRLSPWLKTIGYQSNRECLAGSV